MRPFSLAPIRLTPTRPMGSSDTTQTADGRTLHWAHGSLTVQQLGAMLAPVRFDLPDGRSVQPMHIPPWADEKLPLGLPPILQGLRGEWPCVPFGADEPERLSADWHSSMGQPSLLSSNAPPHGESSNCLWDWKHAGGDRLTLHLDYPANHPIAWVEREIIPDPNAPAIDCILRTMPRTDCCLPIGLHPTFALPADGGSARIITPSAKHVRSYPGSLEPGADIFEADSVFNDLVEAPANKGGTIDASRVPFGSPGEDLLQLIDIAEGFAALDNQGGGYRVTLTWNAEHFPSLLIWYSNRGRQHEPWNGRHTALGLEPICSAFDLGAGIASVSNPIASQGTRTCFSFRGGKLFQSRYRISGELHASAST